MNRLKRTLAFLLVLVMVISMAACVEPGNESTPAPSTSPTTGKPDAVKGTYTVTVKTNGGMAMADLGVYIYGDEALSDMKKVGTTDKNGMVSFDLDKSGTYYVTLEGVADGFNVQPYYQFNGNVSNIMLTSSLVTDKTVADVSSDKPLTAGNVMYDFEVTTSTGETWKLSEVLAEKELVVLNFWYTTCSWCMEEFPVMDEVYQNYTDDVAIIALDPLDSVEAVKSFAEGYGYSFPMASCSGAFSTAFGIEGYPTSVFIDRYGMICLVESGALTSKNQFVSIFEHFLGDDYQQSLAESGAEWIERVKPTYEMSTSEDIAALINNGGINVTYRPETDDEYSWPFIITEKDGINCIKASNQGIDDSYAILYADVYLEAGQAIGFDYMISSEQYSDILHVVVNDEPIYSIHGVKDVWSTAYPWVAQEAGTYEVALCYIKDGDINDGDDTAYIANMHVANVEDIDVATYIPRQPAVEVNGEYTYVEIYLNENDGYYHVGSVDGPLLLANLMSTTLLSDDNSVYLMAYAGEFEAAEDRDNPDAYKFYPKLLPYCTNASNSALNGYCTVNAELAQLLQHVASIIGFDGTEQEWLKMCRYYDAYGTGGVQLIDPIKGLAVDSAYEAVLGKSDYNAETGEYTTNCFYYDGRPIMPRGLFAEFIPAETGVYRITSHAASVQGVNAWIFDKDRNILEEYDWDERLYNDVTNVSMVMYMEAGTPYYINIAFWDVYEAGYIPYDIEFLGTDYKLFRGASVGPFTYIEGTNHIIMTGIDVILNPADGYYHEDLGLDENGNQIYGGILYADFIGQTTLFSMAINPTMIDLGGFDFTKTDLDLEILSYLKKHDGDVAATDAYLRELWGESYTDYAEMYKIEDVFDGIYHGKGEDLTEEIKAYVAKMEDGSNGEELTGCVAVDARLAEILQMFMDKYTFSGVENCWLKVCYFYDDLTDNTPKYLETLIPAE